MILIALLIVPVLFWLIPFASMQQQDSNELRRFFINFGAMLLSCGIIGVVLWQLEMDWMTRIIVLLAVSAAWAVLFHLINRR